MNKIGCLAYRKSYDGKVEKNPVGIIIADTTKEPSYKQYSNQYLVLLDKHVSEIGWTVPDCPSGDRERFKLIGKYMTDKSNRYWFFLPFELVIKNKLGVLNNE